MAVILGTEDLSVTTLRRTWRITIESPVNAVPHMSAHRELIKKSGDDIVSQNQQAGVVVRSLAQVANDQLELHDGTIITPAQIAEGLVILIEAAEAVDLAPPAPAPESEE